MSLKNLNVDKVGIACSSLCALHCFSVAFLPTLVIAFGSDILLSGYSEWGFTVVAILFASLACWRGLRRHRSKAISALFLVGIIGLISSRTIEEFGGAHHHDHGHGGEASATANEFSDKDSYYDQWIDSRILGTFVGVSSGLLLLGGHWLSLNRSRCAN